LKAFSKTFSKLALINAEMAGVVGDAFLNTSKSTMVEI